VKAIISDVQERITKAQSILSTLSTYRIEVIRGRVVFSFLTPDHKIWSRRWKACSSGSFYPVWRAPYHGGTFEVCLAQLARYVNGKPHLPMGWWKRAVAVGCDDKVLAAATAAGWPESFPCVHCGKELTTGYDWWSLNGIEGICCWGGECRKKRGATA
jgi:hypothetical protein